MTNADPAFETKARQAIVAELRIRKAFAGRRRAYLVSYPRSGSTLLREYCAILQGRPQLSVYADDIVAIPGAALTDALDHVAIVKSHQMPAGNDPVVYLIRDGRNAMLSFLYMTFLFGGHHFSRCDEVCDGLRHLDRTEGSWAAHVAAALQQCDARPTLILRFEDLRLDAAGTLRTFAAFLDAELPAAVIDACLRRHAVASSYTAKFASGYTHAPQADAIYALLQRHRNGDYWRPILDRCSKRHIHESGATGFLLRFGYEHAPDWWVG